MKHYLIIALFMTFAIQSFGQTPDSTEKKFGSSLEKYKSKQKQPDTSNTRKNVDPNNEEIIRVETELVMNDVLVSDKSGNLITNLTKGDFIVTENGEPQTIEMFSIGENSPVSRSIVLIIDNSAAQFQYFKNSIMAAKLLVDKLSPNDKLAIVTAEVKLVVNFTQDKTLLKNKLDLLEKKSVRIGSGLEFNTLLAVLNEMFTAEDKRPIIIFQGDGNEIIWVKTDKDSPYKVSKSTRDMSGMKYVGEEKLMANFGFSDIKEAIESSRATIYSIVSGYRFLGLSKKEQETRSQKSLERFNNYLGINNRNLSYILYRFQDVELERQVAGQTAMKTIAELSGGYMDFIEKEEDAERVYSDIFKQIENRYAIGYYPTNQEQKEKRRTVKIEVRNHPEYIVTGRKTYFATEQ